MNITSGNILLWLGVFGLVTTAAAVLAGTWRISRNTATVNNFRDSALSWETKSKSQDEEIEKLHRDLAARDREVSDLQGRVGTLQDMVTGKSAVEELTSSMTQLVALFDTRLTEALAHSAETRAEIRGNTRKLDDLAALVKGRSQT